MDKLVALLLVIATTTSLVQGAANNLVKENRSNEFCKSCRSFVSELARFHSSNNRVKNEKLLQNFCTEYYSENKCHITIKAFFSILEKIDESFCDTVAACGVPEGTSIGLIEFNEIEDDVECDICRDMVENVQKELTNTSIIDSFLGQMDMLCGYLKVVDMEMQCKNEVHRYTKQVIDFVEKMDPTAFCKSLQLCKPKFQPIYQAVNAFKGFGIQTGVKLGEASKRSEPEVSSPNCALCKMIVVEINHMIKNNRTEKNILQALDNVCHKVFSGDKLGDCLSIVDVYVRELLDILAQETKPEFVCMLIAQCAYSPNIKSSLKLVEPFDMDNFIRMIETGQYEASKEVCIECEMFVKYLHNVLGHEKSQEQIKNWLIENFCNNLKTKKNRDSCSSLFINYADAFYESLSQELEPKVVCSKIGTCSAKVEIEKK